MPLTDAEKELWMQYQNEVAKPISDMTHEELQKFIDQCESTIFEAKAKQSKAQAEKALRALEAKNKVRSDLIGNPRYSPPDSPSNLKATAAYKKEQKEKKEKAPKVNLFGGLDLAELAAEMKAKKNAEKTS